jgi:hypothetical protein
MGIVNTGFYVAGAGQIPVVNSGRASLHDSMHKFVEQLAAVAGDPIVRRSMSEPRANVHQLDAELRDGWALRLRVILNRDGWMMFAATANRRGNAMSATDGGRFLDSLRSTSR